MEHEAYLDLAASEATHWWFRGRRQVLRAIIKSLKLPANSRILELGAGTGGNLAMLGAFGRVIAVEMNDTARLIAASKNAGASIEPGRLPDGLPFGAEQKFDLIGLFDVLEHVEAEAETLAVLRQHLAPSGFAIITVPAFQFLWSQHDVVLHHKRRYGKAELRAKLQAAGLTVQRLSFINMALFPAAVAARLWDRLRPGPKVSGTGMPPAWLNTSFAALFGAESYIVPSLNLPVGLSLLAVVRLQA
jgi:SAM-dependent methyltransferase